MKFLAGMIFVLLVVEGDVGGIPAENQAAGDGPPDVSGAAEGAEALLSALAAGDPSLARDFFFPAKAFDLVKDIPVPARYYKKLVDWYDEDIHLEHPRFAKGEWRFQKVELGSCKWQDVGTEGNAVAYWSCRRNFVTAVQGEETRRFEIRVLINWGSRWYVTHLRPIRQ